MHFADRLLAAIKSKGNPVCVGIDPNVESFPKHLQEGDPINAIEAFSKTIIDAVADVVPAVKPQAAYFAQYGGKGMMIYETVIQYAKSKGLLVIADAKLGDIGSTAAAYAAGFLSESGFNADAVTVNPYMGSDSVEPFVKQCAETKGIFVLVKTSNPGSSDLQDIGMADGMLFDHVAHLVNKWGKKNIGACGYSAVGAVVGATYPRQLAMLRKQMPQQIILVPGYGAQGAGAADIVSAFDADKQGALIVAARSVIYAYKQSKRPPEEYALAARDAAVQMAEEICSAL